MTREEYMDQCVDTVCKHCSCEHTCMIDSRPHRAPLGILHRISASRGSTRRVDQHISATRGGIGDPSAHSADMVQIRRRRDLVDAYLTSVDLMQDERLHKLSHLVDTQLDDNAESLRLTIKNLWAEHGRLKRVELGTYKECLKRGIPQELWDQWALDWVI